MNDLSVDPPGAMSDGRNDPEQQTEEESIFFNEVSDEQLEAAALRTNRGRLHLRLRVTELFSRLSCLITTGR